MDWYLGLWDLTMPFPLLIAAGAILAIASNCTKQIRRRGQFPAQRRSAVSTSAAANPPSFSVESPSAAASPSSDTTFEPKLPDFLVQSNQVSTPPISFEIQKSDPIEPH
ncbi:MAG: hypothetical protein ACFE0I_12845 [Elainellaceae cyanobacterium]